MNLSTSTFAFDFTVPAPGTVHTLSMPFQVGLYKVGSPIQAVNQLSANLVPEPATLVLRGSGLAGRAARGRRRRIRGEKKA